MKMFHFIFDYNYGNFFIDFDNFCTVGNRNEYSTKRVQTVSLRLNYVSTLPAKTKNNTKTAARLLQHSVEPIVPKFYRKSFSARFFPYLLEHSFSSHPTKNFYILVGFIKNVSSNSIWLILTCKLKLNCRDMRHVTVMT